MRTGIYCPLPSHSGKQWDCRRAHSFHRLIATSVSSKSTWESHLLYKHAQLDSRCHPVNLYSILVQNNFAGHYEQLGVPENASEDDIKRAFRKAARTLHPDVNPGNPAAAERFMAVLQAYQALTEPGARNAYDAQIGTATARARDPRFARFERWRNEVVPYLELYLNEWSQEVRGLVNGWLNTLKIYDAACQDALEACVRTDGVRHPGLSSMDVSSTSNQEMDEFLASELLLAVQQLEKQVQDGKARMLLYVEKRFEQVSVMFPAYPEIVWEAEWYAASDGWVEQMDSALQPWRERALYWRAKATSLKQAPVDNLKP